MRIDRTSLRSRSHLVGAALLVGFAGSCSLNSSSQPFGFTIHRSRVSVAGSTQVAISGRYFAFLCDEATTGPGGTDMNGDGDRIDSIAVMVNANTNVETKLNVAAESLLWIEDELYMVVDEAADGRDWNGDADMNDVVLLHVNALTPSQTPDFIDTLDGSVSTKAISYRSNLFYSRSRAATNPLESNLAVINALTPLTPTAVPTLDANGPLSPRILGKDEGLLFFGLDETVEGRDLNGDGDATDTNVLALMDGTLATGSIHSTGLAMPVGIPPFRARRTASGSHDWQVGFLVDEAAQGATNLNDPALFSPTWKPSQCSTFEDTDHTDWVLHYLFFAAWNADDATSPPRNTGLVGTRKIAIANGYIATITPEHDAGDNGGLNAEGDCDLNGDGDRDDYVVRWTQMVPSPAAILPLTPAANIHALSDVPGGTHGLAEVSTRFVIQVSEPQDNLDINNDGQKTFDFVGCLLPNGSGNTNTPWDFIHGSSGNICFGGSWMGEVADRSRMVMGLLEKSYGIFGTTPGVNLNAHNPPLPGEDTDILDSIPVFPNILSGNTLNIPGVAIAVQTANAGIVVTKGDVFYRVSESEDSRDWNGDGLETGFVLYATSLGQQVSVDVGTMNSLAGRPSIEYDVDGASPSVAVYLADEQLQGPTGTDFNFDGDKSDLVITWFSY